MRDLAIGGVSQGLSHTGIDLAIGGVSQGLSHTGIDLKLSNRRVPRGLIF